MKAPASAFAIALFVTSCSAPGGGGVPGNLKGSVYRPGNQKPVDSVLKVSVGQKAPDFMLPSVSGKRISLSSYRGNRNVVLTFVPAAYTPVCSAQWPGYNISLGLFEERDATLLGITTDNVPSLHAWTVAMGGLDFEVLSDFWPHGAAASRYGVLRSDGTTERALIVVDKQGVIRYIDVHDINKRPPLEDVIAALDGLGG